MKKSIIIIGLLLVLAVALGVYALTREDSGQNTNTNGSNGSSEDTGAATDDVITYTDAGFSPATMTVAAGTTVTVANESSEDLAFRSNPHPGHNENPELNQEDTLSSGESKSFVVSGEGTWGYHNHLNPDKTGTITVE